MDLYMFRVQGILMGVSENPYRFDQDIYTLEFIESPDKEDFVYLVIFGGLASEILCVHTVSDEHYVLIHILILVQARSNGDF